MDTNATPCDLLTPSVGDIHVVVCDDTVHVQVTTSIASMEFPSAQSLLYVNTWRDPLLDTWMQPALYVDQENRVPDMLRLVDRIVGAVTDNPLFGSRATARPFATGDGLVSFRGQATGLDVRAIEWDVDKIRSAIRTDLPSLRMPIDKRVIVVDARR